MSKTGFPIGIALGSVFVSVIILSWQTGVAFVDLEPDESEIGATTVLYILIGYLIYLLRHFVVNEGRKYTISAFSISVILATVGAITYDQQVGGWFWNDDWVMEEALIASIRPVIILLLLNEFFGVAERGVNNFMNAGQDYVTSLVRIGIIASLPLVVITPPLALGLLSLIVTLIIFFILYWASTDTPYRLDNT